MSDEPYKTAGNLSEFREVLSSMQSELGDISVEIRSSFSISTNQKPLKLELKLGLLPEMEENFLELIQASPVYQVGIFPNFQLSEV